MLGDHPFYPVLLAQDLAAARDSYHGRLGLEIIAERDGSFNAGFAPFAWIVGPGGNVLGSIQRTT